MKYLISQNVPLHHHSLYKHCSAHNLNVQYIKAFLLQMWNLLTVVHMHKCKPESLICILTAAKINHSVTWWHTAVVLVFSTNKYSKNVSKHKANTLGNVCYCSCRANSGECHYKLCQQDQMAVVMRLKQGIQCVCKYVSLPLQSVACWKWYVCWRV